MKQTQRMVLAALFAAFCCVATMVIKFTPPGTLGYIHLGDALVLLSGIILGPIYGGLAAGIGSMMADILSGYAMWAPGTFLIKAICAILAGFLFRKFKVIRKNNSVSIPLLSVVTLLPELFMVASYFLYGSFLMFLVTGDKKTMIAAFSSSLTGVPANLVQGLVGIIITCLLVPVFLKISDIRSFMLQEKTTK